MTFTLHHDDCGIRAAVADDGYALPQTELPATTEVQKHLVPSPTSSTDDLLAHGQP
ncbi:hypothetical protein [Thalassospira sp. MCCC 1A03138]|uniref:hypothetical protein n=1 Tax=Thalassospira sp. MCCC 1A03138 TaxID=1470576 RepID=UPI00143D06F0|nr:hypothetical protein [Thalassospira sp. MCCC 1A03138]